MTDELKADDLIQLVMKLSPRERCRLLQLMFEKSLIDSKGLPAESPKVVEYSSGDELYSWDIESGNAVKFFNLRDRD